jgi:hypothetical protein
MSKIDNAKSLTNKEIKHLIYALELVKNVIDEYANYVESGDIIYNRNAVVALDKLFRAILYLDCNHDGSCDCGHISMIIRDASKIINKSGEVI